LSNSLKISASKLADFDRLNFKIDHFKFSRGGGGDQSTTTTAKSSTKIKKKQSSMINNNQEDQDLKHSNDKRYLVMHTQTLNDSINNNNNILPNHFNHQRLNRSRPGFLNENLHETNNNSSLNRMSYLKRYIANNSSSQARQKSGAVVPHQFQDSLWNRMPSSNYSLDFLNDESSNSNSSNLIMSKTKKNQQNSGRNSNNNDNNLSNRELPVVDLQLKTPAAAPNVTETHTPRQNPTRKAPNQNSVKSASRHLNNSIIKKQPSHSNDFYSTNNNEEPLFLQQSQSCAKTNAKIMKTSKIFAHVINLKPSVIFFGKNNNNNNSRVVGINYQQKSALNHLPIVNNGGSFVYHGNNSSQNYNQNDTFNNSSSNQVPFSSTNLVNLSANSLLVKRLKF
jgi:hypothetical protein